MVLTDEERKAKDKARRQTPAYLAQVKAHRQTDEYKAKAKAYKQTDEYKAKAKAYKQTDEYKERERENRTKPERKAVDKANRDRPENKAKRKEERDRPENKVTKKSNRLKPETIEKEKARRKTPAYRAQENARRQIPENKSKAKLKRTQLALTPKGKAKIDASKILYALERLNVLLGYSKRHSNSDVPCCRCCGENSFVEFLDIDHIIGKKQMDSVPELVKIGYSSKFKIKKLITWITENDFPEGFQILCKNCNGAKGVYGKCPHEK